MTKTTSLLSLLLAALAIAAAIISWLFFTLQSNNAEIDNLRGEVSTLKDTVGSYESYAAVNGKSAEPESGGKILGALCSSHTPLPRGEVVAKRTDSGDVYTQELSDDDLRNKQYTIELSAGTYLMRYQEHTSNTSKYDSVYYTECAKKKNVSCSTNSHQLIPVVVVEGETTGSIDLCDFSYSKEPKF